MTYLSCLDSTNNDLVLDTSVIINLNASGVAAEILRALPCSVLVVDIAANEVLLDSKNGRNDGDLLNSLISQDLVSVVRLDTKGTETFEQLVLVLDDGEAATIAAASERQAVAVFDERKARRISNDQFPSLTHASSLDLFSHPDVITHLGEEKVADAVYLALKDARMSVRNDQRSWVIDLIGNERAAECTSIPRYRRMI